MNRTRSVSQVAGITLLAFLPRVAETQLGSEIVVVSRSRIYRKSLISLALVLLFVACAQDSATGPEITSSFLSAAPSMFTLLDQSYDPGPENLPSLGIKQGLDRAQSFTVGATGQLIRVNLFLRRDDNLAGVDTDLLFDLRPAVSGLPIPEDGSALVSVRIPASSIPNSADLDPIGAFFGWVTVDLGDGVSVSAGDDLAIVLRSNATTGGHAWATEGVNAYAGGFDSFRLGLNPTFHGSLGLDAGFQTFLEGSCSGVTEISQQECDALVALYDATDGDNWTRKARWLNTSAPCEWEGVGCFEGSIQSLVMNSNHLVGTLPPGLGDLAHLELLALAHNQLIGPIPPEFGNLRSLGEVVLSSNQLSGPIPPELGNLADLKRLSLPFNQLSGGIPPELGRLANLTVLELTTNPLGGPIPPEIGNLANLQGLHLTNSQLTGAIPPELGNLTNLDALFLGTNQLEGPIPVELGFLVNLERIVLATNALTGVVPLPVAVVFAAASFCSAKPGNDGLYMPATPEYQALGDPMCRISLTPLTDVATQITNQIADLVSSGELRHGFGNALARRFENAIRTLSQGRAAQATRRLRSLIRQITRLINRGGISAADGDNLIAAAGALMP